MTRPLLRATHERPRDRLGEGRAILQANRGRGGAKHCTSSARIANASGTFGGVSTACEFVRGLLVESPEREPQNESSREQMQELAVGEYRFASSISRFLFA